MVTARLRGVMRADGAVDLAVHLRGFFEVDWQLTTVLLRYS